MFMTFLANLSHILTFFAAFLALLTLFFLPLIAAWIADEFRFGPRWMVHPAFALPVWFVWMAAIVAAMETLAPLGAAA